MTITSNDDQYIVEPTFVTPDIAASWLKKEVSYQRRIADKTVSEYAKLMRQGQWQFTPMQAIAISADGEVVDGRHRLKAVVESGMTVKLPILRNADPKVFGALDRGRARNLAQIASMGKVKYSARYHVSCANSLIWSVEAPTTVTKTWNAADLVDVMNYCEPFLDIIFIPGTTSTSHLLGSYFRGAVLRALIHHAGNEKMTARIANFCQIAASGMPYYRTVEDDKPLELRNYLTQNRRSGAREVDRKYQFWTASLMTLHFYLGNMKGRPPKSAHKIIKKQPFPIALDQKPKYEAFSAWLKRQ